MCFIIIFYNYTAFIKKQNQTPLSLILQYNLGPEAPECFKILSINCTNILSFGSIVLIFSSLQTFPQNQKTSSLASASPSNPNYNFIKEVQLLFYSSFQRILTSIPKRKLKFLYFHQSDSHPSINQKIKYNKNYTYLYTYHTFILAPIGYRNDYSMTCGKGG